MKTTHLMIFCIIILVILVSGCTSKKCPSDLKECPGKYKVIRNPSNNCEFDPCPQKCETIADCQDYCGNNKCLMPSCAKSNYDPDSSITYCACLGLCGVK